MRAAGGSPKLCRAVCPSGRVSGLPAHPEHEGLCPYRARAAELGKSLRERNLLEELRSPAGKYITQSDINHVLGKLSHFGGTRPELGVRVDWQVQLSAGVSLQMRGKRGQMSAQNSTALELYEGRRKQT
jgi:hypothetical protein